MRIRLNQSLFLLITLIILSLSIYACGGGGSDSTPAPTPTNSIGSSGGEVTSSDGKVVVSVPQGALSQQTDITVNEALNPPSGNIGVAYEFGPSGTVFSQPVTISITYDETQLQSVNEADLRLGEVENGQWIAVSDSSVDVAANVVTGTTTHFSIYGVIAADNVTSFTLTVLPNGKVLVAGGCTADPCTTVLASAELYDPSASTWTSTGSMTTSRLDHTAALLPNGKVLVAGGEGTGNVFASAELYDPATGTWTATGSMNTGRFFFTASGENSSAILPNGQILIAGGGAGACCPATVLASAELYSTSIATSGGGSSKAFIGSSDGQMVSQDNGHSSGFGCGSIDLHGSGPKGPSDFSGLGSIILLLSLPFLMRWRSNYRRKYFHC